MAIRLHPSKSTSFQTLCAMRVLDSVHDRSMPCGILCIEIVAECEWMSMDVNGCQWMSMDVNLVHGL